MIHIVFCSEHTDSLSSVKNIVVDACSDINCTYLSFEYTMDMLDYINTARPEKCAVFFLTNSISNGLEAASKANEINPMYRFNLFCPDCDDVERLFYKGISYFVKIPFSSESVIRAVEFLKRFYNEQMHKSLLLKSKHGIESIIFSDIKYVMSDKRKVIIYKQTEESAYYYKLDEIEAMLGAGFLRCHQSFIVNMEMIKAFVPEGLILTDETFIPVSRKKYYAAKREYLEYITDNQII